MKILIADDHIMVRDGIQLLLHNIFDEINVLEAEDYDKAIIHAENNHDIELMILDLSMPGKEPLKHLCITSYYS